MPSSLVPIVDFFGANWHPLLRAMMNGAPKAAPVILLLIATGFALMACDMQQVTNDLQETAEVATMLQPVASGTACEAQKIANDTGNATGSLVAGTFCNGLAAGAPLPSAVATIAGQSVTLPTATGTITLPVPSAAKPSS
jgi:hypothetical protein